MATQKPSRFGAHAEAGVHLSTSLHSQLSTLSSDVRLYSHSVTKQSKAFTELANARTKTDNLEVSETKEVQGKPHKDSALRQENGHSRHGPPAAAVG